VLANLANCRDADGKGSQFNYGGYCNKEVDELTKQVLVETDTKKRDELIHKAFTIIHDEAGLIPLHQQSLAWGVSKKVDIAQRADNQILLYWVQKKD
jgi:peptide/nickel transport system substrate-binding protein